MINLKEFYGRKYRIGYDGTVQAYPELKSDPDYQIILCRHGEIYAYSYDLDLKSELLAVWVRGGKRIKKMREEIPGLIIHNDGEGKAIFLFKPELLDRVGQYVGIRRRRQLSPEAKARIIKATEPYRFTPKSTEQTAVQDIRNDELF